MERRPTVTGLGETRWALLSPRGCSDTVRSPVRVKAPGGSAATAPDDAWRARCGLDEHDLNSPFIWTSVLDGKWREGRWRFQLPTLFRRHAIELA